MLSRLVKNQYSFALFSKTIHIAFALLNSVFINRYLGPTLKGEYAYILNVINILTLILNLGITTIYSFYKRKGVKDLRDKYTIITFIQMVTYLLLGAILCNFISTLESILIFTLTPLMIFANNIRDIAMIEDIGKRNKINIVSSFFYTVILFIIFVFSVKNYILIFASLYIKEFIEVVYIFYRFNLRIQIKYFDKNLLLELIVRGFYPMITSLLITFNYQIDIIILKGLVSFEEVGYYSVGVALASLVWIIPNAFKEVLIFKTAKDNAIDDILFSIKLNIYVSLVIFIVMLCSGKLIIKILYGIEYLNSYGVTVVIFLGMIPMVFYKMINPLYLANGKYKQMFNILSISVLINVVMNYLMVPHLGIVGAALASVFSYTVCGISFVNIFVRDYNIKLKQLFMISNDEKSKLVSILNKSYRK